jgi:aryl-alcohol dehydrogenase-like predicted oxidoreductase
VDVCAENGLAFLPWYPLGAGALANARGKLADVARRRGATPSQIALAWLLRRSLVMVPIPGTSSIAHFEENLVAIKLRLSEEEFATLSRAS